MRLYTMLSLLFIQLNAIGKREMPSVKQYILKVITFVYIDYQHLLLVGYSYQRCIIQN